MIDKITIVAVDDHVIFMEGLSSLFQQYPSFSLEAKCHHRNDMFSLLESHAPDILLLDISMPGDNIEKILETLNKKYSNIPVIALTMCAEPSYAKSLLNLGLRGYVLKDSAFEDLESAIHAVIEGGTFISAPLLKEIETSVDFLLTVKEKLILTFLAKGLSNKEIAREANISERTVRFHISNCMTKLNASGRSHLVAIALKKSIVHLSAL